MTAGKPALDQQTACHSWLGPLLVQSDGPRTIESWALDRRDWLDAALLEHGALLLRGFKIDSPAGFRSACEAILDRPLEYLYRSTPRTKLDHGVYTATEYPADCVIPFHNENAYQRDWPMKLVFCCLQPAETGGETPLVRTSDVTAALGVDVVRTFEERQVLYVRNYVQGADLPWQTVFQTDSRAEVEAFCRQESIEWEWLGDGQLRTRQVCQGVATHPRTRQKFFFNQAHLFHVSSLGDEAQEAMIEIFGESDLPRNAYFGDGEPIDAGILAAVRAAYDREAFTFRWEKNDLIVLDNMLVAHGRSRFTGNRKVLVAMGEPFSSLSSSPMTD